ncbi:MAG: DUF2061 domain-containing protein [Candidatus Bathyarchaeota archaeon]|nr:DUF2061 domain-containing protein [Candidatus Bathyarchaeota archaeon]
MESRKRSMVKSVVWRLMGIVILGVITWAYTKNVAVTTVVTLLFHSIRLVLYYFHERAWDGITWGLKTKSELTEQEIEQVNERLRKLGYLE